MQTEPSPVAGSTALTDSEKAEEFKNAANESFKGIFVQYCMV